MVPRWAPEHEGIVVFLALALSRAPGASLDGDGLGPPGPTNGPGRRSGFLGLRLCR